MFAPLTVASAADFHTYRFWPTLIRIVCEEMGHLIRWEANPIPTESAASSSIRGV